MAAGNTAGGNTAAGNTAGGHGSLKTFLLPDVGEGLTEAEILGWQIEVGDLVEVNQALVEIETAKAAVELPSPWAGRVHAILVAQGQTVDVGTPIITIDIGGSDSGSGSGSDETVPASVEAGSVEAGSAESGGAKIGEMTADGRIATLVGYVSTQPATARRPRKSSTVPASPAQAAAPVPPVPPAPVPAAPVPAAQVPATAAAQATVPLATPPVRKLAKDLGVDLRTVAPTGPNGVITRGDVQASAGGPPSIEPSLPEAAYDPATRQRRVPIKGIRKAMAAAMVSSAFSIPHVTEFLSVDVTEMMQLRTRLQARPEFADLKLTPLVFAARAVILALGRTPDLNAFWDDAAQEIVYQEYVHLGIAAATPRGLVVPKVHDADAMDLRQLAVALSELTETARAGKTSPTAMAGGTFTITNVGVFGIDTGTPIINPGESGILALGSIRDAPWVVDGALAVRKVCQLAVSFDHRVVDGQMGSRFLADVGAVMAEPGLALAW